MCADGDVTASILVFDLGELNITADRGISMYLDAGREDKLDVAIQLFLRQTVVGMPYRSMPPSCGRWSYTTTCVPSATENKPQTDRPDRRR